MEITIDGKRYKLVPVEEVDEVESYVSAVQQEAPVETIQPPQPVDPATGVRQAVPKISSYREKFNKHQLSLTDLKVAPKMIRELPSQDGSLESYNYKGERLFFGEGIEQEF